MAHKTSHFVSLLVLLMRYSTFNSDEKRGCLQTINLIWKKALINPWLYGSAVYIVPSLIVLGKPILV
jgi:hypothetical protein